MDKPKTVKLTAGDRTFYVFVNLFLVFIKNYIHNLITHNFMYILETF